eukprot:scaffold115382_cov75-Phaeocystis_antarctica.AAC.2
MYVDAGYSSRRGLLSKLQDWRRYKDHLKAIDKRGSVAGLHWWGGGTIEGAVSAEDAMWPQFRRGLNVATKQTTTIYVGGLSEHNADRTGINNNCPVACALTDRPTLSRPSTPVSPGLALAHADRLMTGRAPA